MAITTPPKLKRRIDSNLIPSAMRELPNWVCALGVHDKAPRRIHSRLGRASSTDPASWSPFDLARKFCEERDLALTFALPLDGSIVAIDLDGAADADGEPFDWAREVLEAAAAARCYLERSISGNGFHVFGRAPRGWNGPNRIPLGDAPVGGKAPALEIFDRGRVIVLGEPLAESVAELGDLSLALEWIRERFIPKPAPVPVPPAVEKPKGDRSRFDLRVSVDEIASRLESRGYPVTRNRSGEIRSCCPAHGGDNRTALRIKANDRGGISITCYSRGCSDAAVAESLGWERSVLYPPPDPAKLPRGGGAGGEASEGAPPPADPRGRHTVKVPKVIGSEDLLAAAVLEAISADPDVFVSVTGRLVEVIERFDPNQTPRLAIVPLPLAGVRELISRRVRFINLEDGLERSIPKFLPSAVADRNTYPGFKTLAGVSRVPILRHDGSISVPRGFDEASGVLIRPRPSATPIEIPESPTRDDGLRAIAELADVVSEFDFAESSDRAAWLAFVLTQVARNAIRGPVPFFAFDGSDRKAGKTLLLTIGGIIAGGEAPPLRFWSDSEEERRKSLYSALIGGVRLIALENVDEIIGRALAGVLTAAGGVCSDRVLGVSQDACVWTWGCVLAGSGNAIAVDSDLARRVVFCRVRPQPDGKSFERDPLEKWCFENRDRLLTAAITMLRAYIVAGRPGAREFPHLNSFEEWSRLIVGCLRWYGEPDPAAATRRIASARDSERERAELILTAVEEACEGSHPDGVTTADLADIAESLFGFQDRVAVKALTAFFGRPINRLRLGKALEKLVGSPRGARVLSSSAARAGVRRWRVVRIGEAGLDGEETADDA